MAPYKPKTATTMRNPFDRWRRRREPPMPTLPVCRPRPLTTIFSSSKTTTSAVANSPFFKLPAEIRRRILINAFGEQILHFDLRLEHPSRKNTTYTKPRHANGYDEDDRDTKKPRQWRWFSCVCHRVPYPMLYQPGQMCFGPTDDKCRFGNTLLADCQSMFHGEVPGICFVGIMGWLLACRQAYVEGIEVLYRTNRFFIDGMTLLRRLPELLVPQRLTAIKAVELFWDFHLWEKGGDPETGTDAFLSALEELPMILPNLRFLFLSLQGKLKHPNVRYGSQELFDASEKLLQLVDGMVVKFLQLTECRIALPASCYGVRKQKIRGKDVAFYFHDEDFQQEAMWRDLPSGQNEGDDSTLKGYWVCHGTRDVPHPEEILVCGFGEPSSRYMSDRV